MATGRKFATASAFSIHCKRLQTPGKQGDDGWKSVLYEGQPLEHFRRRLAASRPPPPPRSASQAALDADAVRRRINTFCRPCHAHAPTACSALQAALDTDAMC